MNLKIFIAMATAIVLSAGTLSAQENVSGVVKDRNGEPLIGANVVVKGTTLFTITGINGEFNIKAADDAVLVITFDGYQPMEVAVADLPTANLQLKPESLNGLETFYGNDNYYALTTANTLIKVDDVETGLETDIYQFLLGRVPGLEVVDGQYRLRGGNSLTGWEDASPLFVVDGVYELCSDMIIGALNPADVESIRVLKDASATAQYGMAAKGGAIVIKTRRPTDKALAVTYDGNASYNTPSGDDSKWEPYNQLYTNKFSTKHNLAVSGVTEDRMPYRISLGYNSENNIIDDYKSDRYSASFWLGPRLFDKHLSIDANGAFRSINEDFDSEDFDDQWISGTVSVDYAVHSFETLHLNVKGNAITNFDGCRTVMADGGISLQHQFSDRHYLELRAGAALCNSEPGDKNEVAVDYKSVYGQFNMAVSRFFMNAHARYNAFSVGEEDFGKMSMAASFGVKPANVLMLRAGLGFLGLSIGDKPAGISKLSTFTANFGVDAGTSKSRINGSADFFFHGNSESPIGLYGANDDAVLNNIGAEFRIDAKIIDGENVKLRIGGTLSCAVGIDFENDGNNSGNDDTRVDISIGGYTIYEEETGNIVRVRPYTYGIYDQVYDQDGRSIPGMFVDYDGNGELSLGDRISSKRSPVPLVIGGFNTYLEVKGVYLQANAHASLDRHNVTFNQNNTEEFVVRNYDDWMFKNGITSDNIRNSSFLRIDNVVLGYKFKNLWKLSGRAYAAVQNPYVYTKYDGCEPEIFYGYDDVFFRRATTFTFGLKLNINIKD